jgi:GrpB-like predicted nucleotidyltransferase (UPF0157 family)
LSKKPPIKNKSNPMSNIATPLRPPIKIVDYDPKWPAIFTEEKNQILSVLKEKIDAIEHVGSTAVQGLGAKPIIDIMVAVRRLSVAEECIKPLRSIGYEYIPEYEEELPERRYFRKGSEEIPNKHFHLHMVERDSDFWKKHLLFRDYLRHHLDTAEQYFKLKKELAQKYSSDHAAYTEAKTPFIESVITEALSNPEVQIS